MLLLFHLLFSMLIHFNIREKAGRAGTTGESVGYYKKAEKAFHGAKNKQKRKNLEVEAT